MVDRFTLDRPVLSRRPKIGTTARHKARKTSQRLRTAFNAPECKNATGQGVRCSLPHRKPEQE